MPRVPSNVNKPTGGRPGDERVTKQSAQLNREQQKQQRKIAKAAESAASKVRSHG